MRIFGLFAVGSGMAQNVPKTILPWLLLDAGGGLHIHATMPRCDRDLGELWLIVRLL